MTREKRFRGNPLVVTLKIVPTGRALKEEGAIGLLSSARGGWEESENVDSRLLAVTAAAGCCLPGRL